MQNKSNNAVTAEQYGVLEKKLFKLQSIPETRECLGRMFLDLMGSEVSNDSSYRQEIVSTVETITNVLFTLEEKREPYDNFTLTITIQKL